MREQKQKTIGVTPNEKAHLDRAKKKYQEHAGENVDWGKFLLTAAIAGLAVLGVYQLIKASKSDPTVKCPECGREFAIALPVDATEVMQVNCPYCKEWLAVQFYAP